MGIPTPKVDSFSYLSERRYLAHPFSTTAVCFFFFFVNLYCFSVPLHSVILSGVEQRLYVGTSVSEVEHTFVRRYVLEWSGTIFVVFVLLHSVLWSGVECAYFVGTYASGVEKNSHGQFVAVFMYQAAPAAGGKLINPLPEVAGVRCMDA
jgi:hypothetical protein